MTDSSSSIAVVVRVRPFSERESSLLSSQSSAPALFVAEGPSSFLTPQPTPPHASSSGTGAVRKILKVMDERIIIFDPDESNALAAFQRKNLPPKFGKKVKDIRFCFDRVFDEHCGQEDVYEGSAKSLVDHVMNGFNSTVFAYGATGCGKTHTISGTLSQPGVIFLIMKDLFARISAKAEDTDFTLSISYLEIYNEQIRDLLSPETGQLHLRENQGLAEVAGLSTKTPTCAQDVVEWITVGNSNRTVNATEANATSSRSHAVLRITVAQRPRGGGLIDSESIASLSVIDLAGSERAAVTKNKGERLIEGANINRSLLALGNCIHALCDPKKRNHVPFRDSKLTRLLKPSLGGNCRTVMIVCVSPSSQHYDETHNTLQYANRAKEIKTKAIRNVISVDRHVAQYCKQIMEQTQLIEQLRAQLKSKTDSATSSVLEQDLRDCETAKRRLCSLAQRDRLITASQARVELSVIEHIQRILRAWRTSAFGEAGIEDAYNEARGTYNGVLKAFDARTAKLQQDCAAGQGVMSLYDSERATLIATFEARPLLSKLFALELQAFDQELSAKIAAAKEAAARTATQIQAQAIYAILDARSKITSALMSAPSEQERVELARVDSQIATASQMAFAALCGSLPTAAFVETAPATNIFASLKRTATPSRFEMDVDDAPSRKAARASIAPPAVPGSVARPAFARRSPKKGVVFGNNRNKSPAKRKVKSVAWRDEAVTDGVLEDVKPDSPSFTTDTSTTDIGTPDIMVSDGDSLMNMAPSPSVASATWSSLSPNPLSAAATTSSVATAAEKMSNMLKQRSAVHKPLRAVSSRPAPALPSVQEDSPFSFLKRDPAATPHTDPGNTSTSSIDSSMTALPRRPSSFSMAPTSSGLVAHLTADTPGTTGLKPSSPRKAARRTSSIGPLRSAKATRRLSTGTSSRSSLSILSVPGSIAPLKRTLSPRKLSAASRPSFIGSNSSSASNSSFSLAPPTRASLGTGPAGLQQLKKKKRASLAPTPMSGVVPGSIFGGGGNAALRAARRTSTMPLSLPVGGAPAAGVGSALQVAIEGRHE